MHYAIDVPSGTNPLLSTNAKTITCNAPKPGTPSADSDRASGPGKRAISA